MDLGQYEILEEVGRGAWGIVYRARHKELNKVVALKKLKDYETPDSPQVERFKREGRVLAGLEHPNIVKVLDAGFFADGTRYIAMEFVRGDTLADLIRRKKFPSDEAVDVVISVAEAIAYAHSKGIIHRDIKPSNIIMKDGGSAIVTDFGIAKEVNARTCATESGELLGTPAYMPPEQISGNVKEIDERSDIYSLGAVLYELLTSKPPFEGNNFFDISTKILNDDPPSPIKLTSAIPKDLETICLKALNKEKKSRYQTADEMLDDLKRFSRGENILAKPPGLLRKSGKLIWKHKYAAVFILLVAALIAVLLLPSQEMIVSEMIFVPEGTFKMTDSNGGLKDVYMKSFFIDKFEVTNLQYKEFVSAAKYSPPKHWKEGNVPKGKEYFPVVNVSYKDAIAYARWAGKRLPTLEEWQKAARGTDGRKYVWGNEDFQKGFCKALGKAPSPVGDYPKDESPFGCYDMAGNVSEWTLGEIICGGNFKIKGVYCTTDYQMPTNPGNGDFMGYNSYSEFIGFRCAKDSP